MSWFRPKELPTADFQVDSYFGAPQETFYSKTPEYRTSYKDVEHLIDAGQFVHIFDDIEASDKNRRNSKPKEFGALVFDVQGRLLAKLRVPFAISDHTAYAIGAALVGKVRPEDLDKGFPGFIAAAIVQDFMKEVGRLDGKSLGLPEKVFGDKKTYEFSLEFPDAGKVEFEIKADGKKFHRKGEHKWQSLYGTWHPFNGENYDDTVLAHSFASLGRAHLFLQARKAHGTIRTDTLAAARWVWAFGPQGKYGLQLAPRMHNKTRREVLSMRQGDIALANSPAANRKRGVEGGIRLYDGREFDPDKAHGTMEDAAVDAGIYFHLRKVDPEGMRFVETLTDADDQKKFLQGNESFKDRPLAGFVYYDEGMLTRGIGVLLETGDTYGQLKKNDMLLFNLSDYDPEALFDLSRDELKALLVQRHSPIVVPLRANRTAAFADFDRAYKAGAGGEMRPEEYHRRRLALINNQAFRKRVMDVWCDLTTRQQQSNLREERKLEDASFDAYGDLEKIVVTDPATGKRIYEPDDIYKRRVNKWNTERQIDVLINEATQGHAIEYSDDPDALDDYKKRLKGVEKKLAVKMANWSNAYELPYVGVYPDSIENARKHLWLLRDACYDARFNNLPECWVINERGQRVEWYDVITMPYKVRQKMWPKFGEDGAKGPHYRFVFQRDAKRHTQIGAQNVFDADKFFRAHASPEFLKWWISFFEEKWQDSSKWYKALVTLASQGPPNMDPSEHNPMTWARVKHDIMRLKNEAASGTSSEWSKFGVSSAPLAQKQIADWEKHADRQLTQHQWTPEKMQAMGFDPATKYPKQNPWFALDPRKVIKLIVPDEMLETSNAHPQHPDWNRFQIVATPNDEERARLKRLPKQWPSEAPQLLLVGASTGMFRLAANAVCKPLTNSADTKDAVEKAQSAYATIGKKLGPKPFMLTFEQLPPVHKAREVGESVQHVTVSSLDWAALVDAKAGGLPAPLKPLGGVILRDLGIGHEFKKGAIRLRRMKAGAETGDEYQGVLASARRITVDDLEKFTDKDAQRFGKLSKADLVSAWRRAFAEMSVRDPKEQKLWLLELAKPVDKASYTYFQRDEQPAASFTATRSAYPDPNRRKAIITTKEAA